MSKYNTLSWQNENALSGYPFNVSFEVENFIVAASFIQFDNYIPTLTLVSVEKDYISLDIIFDDLQTTTVKFYKSAYLLGEAYRYIKIYSNDTNRYFGTITFGIGALNLWNMYVGRKIKSNLQFMTSTVRSIPKKDAVYTFDGLFGDLKLGRADTDLSIFYNTSENTVTEHNVIMFNAVHGHAPLTPDPRTLKKINLVSPVNNNISLESNDVIKITAVEGETLTIDLISGNTDKAFSIPTLFS
jgi:hypothetical protein